MSVPGSSDTPGNSVCTNPRCHDGWVGRGDNESGGAPAFACQVCRKQLPPPGSLDAPGKEVSEPGQTQGMQNRQGLDAAPAAPAAIRKDAAHPGSLTSSSGSLDEQDTPPSGNLGGFASEARGTDAFSVHAVQRDVADFHRALDIPIGESFAIRRPALRADLIREEAEETCAAIMRGDLIEAIDGLCDLLCVTYGAAAEFGINLAPFWDEVHRTNMAKVGGPVREDGKRLKPEGWTPPDIRGVLDAVKAQSVTPEPVGDSEKVAPSSGGSSVTREARAAFIRWCKKASSGNAQTFMISYADELLDAAEALEAALVAATARAEQQERLTADWRHHSGQTTVKLRAAEARADQAERERDEAVERADVAWDDFLHAGHDCELALGEARAAEARAVELERERDELRQLGNWLGDTLKTADVRAGGFEAALTEIARGGTDYSPGYGGSWASRVARHALARDGDAT